MGTQNIKIKRSWRSLKEFLNVYFTIASFYKDRFISQLSLKDIFYFVFLTLFSCPFYQRFIKLFSKKDIREIANYTKIGLPWLTEGGFFERYESLLLSSGEILLKFIPEIFISLFFFRNLFKKFFIIFKKEKESFKSNNEENEMIFLTVKNVRRYDLFSFELFSLVIITLVYSSLVFASRTFFSSKELKSLGYFLDYFFRVFFLRALEHLSFFGYNLSQILALLILSANECYLMLKPREIVFIEFFFPYFKYFPYFKHFLASVYLFLILFGIASRCTKSLKDNE